MSTDITLDDMLTGVVLGCATRHVESFQVHTPAFFEAIMAAFQTMEAYAEQGNDVELRFWLCLDPLYRDNSQVSEGIAFLVQRRMITLDGNGQMAYIQCSASQAEKTLKDLPGDTVVYKACADAFLSSLR